ncbi:DMT family transporter [Maritalea porphyrae]|uniref:Transporter n=1 Tax=Maritalea porphyrae TaxID=880732 RepID=A0ABQ5UP92_9HYPH|nr:DMT family transporter [Maritalea porphyrae]GLQ16161.1 transporter [Maritalea porphyrae]
MDQRTCGWVFGFIGVAIFSGSLVATRAAVEGFDPLFLTAVRAVLAALAGGVALLVFAKARPEREDVVPLLIVAGGVVVGFPLLTALALQQVTSAHSTVFIGLLPLATAIFGVLRAGDRTHPLFWLFSGLGSLVVVGFALSQGARGTIGADIMMLAAIVACGLGYAEGAKLSRKFGGWQVISWALLLSLPVSFPAALITLPDGFADVPVTSWIALFYVSMFSMLIGFVFWYRGLAQGGIAAVSQLQLLQPFMGLVLAAILLREHVSVPMLLASSMVVLCVAGSKRFAHAPNSGPVIVR